VDWFHGCRLRAYVCWRVACLGDDHIPGLLRSYYWIHSSYPARVPLHTYRCRHAHYLVWVIFTCVFYARLPALVLPRLCPCCYWCGCTAHLRLPAACYLSRLPYRLPGFLLHTTLRATCCRHLRARVTVFAALRLVRISFPLCAHYYRLQVLDYAFHCHLNRRRSLRCCPVTRTTPGLYLQFRFTGSRVRGLPARQTYFHSATFKRFAPHLPRLRSLRFGLDCTHGCLPRGFAHRDSFTHTRTTVTLHAAHTCRYLLSMVPTSTWLPRLPRVAGTDPIRILPATTYACCAIRYALPHDYDGLRLVTWLLFSLPVTIACRMVVRVTRSTSCRYTPRCRSCVARLTGTRAVVPGYRYGCLCCRMRLRTSATHRRRVTIPAGFSPFAGFHSPLFYRGYLDFRAALVHLPTPVTHALPRGLRAWILLRWIALRLRTFCRAARCRVRVCMFLDRFRGFCSTHTAFFSFLLPGSFLGCLYLRCAVHESMQTRTVEIFFFFFFYSGNARSEKKIDGHSYSDEVNGRKKKSFCALPPLPDYGCDGFAWITVGLRTARLIYRSCLYSCLTHARYLLFACLLLDSACVHYGSIVRAFWMRWVAHAHTCTPATHASPPFLADYLPGSFYCLPGSATWLDYLGLPARACADYAFAFYGPRTACAFCVCHLYVYHAAIDACYGSARCMRIWICLRSCSTYCGLLPDSCLTSTCCRTSSAHAGVRGSHTYRTPGSALHCCGSCTLGALFYLITWIAIPA